LAPSNPDILRGQDARAPAPAAGAERIAAALEPELTRIIDMTMERVAAIEQQSTREAREAMAESEQDSRDALERSSRVVETVDAVTGTVGKMTAALQTEVEQVAAALRGLQGLRMRLPGEPPGGSTPDRHEEPPTNEAVTASGAAEPGKHPLDQELMPDPQLTEVFRGHITEMRNDGKSREEAERVLKRLKHGRRFLGMLDDIYLAPPPMGAARRKRSLIGRLLRGT